MDIQREMRRPELRAAYDEGEVVVDGAVKTHPFVSTVETMTASGWKLSVDAKRAAKTLSALRGEEAQARVERVAAKARVHYWDADKAAFDAAAVAEAGSFEKAELWSAVKPDIDILDAKVAALEGAVGLAERDAKEAVYLADDFDEQADALWAGLEPPADLRLGEVAEFRARAAAVKVGLDALILGQAMVLGAGMEEMKVLRKALRDGPAESPVRPSLGRIHEAEDARQKAAVAAEKAKTDDAAAVREKRRVEAAEDARYRNPRAEVSA